MTENQFAHFLQNKGLYDKIEINQNNISDLISLIGGEVRIQEYCTGCKVNSVFTMNPVMAVLSNGDNISLAEYLSQFQKNLSIANSLIGEKKKWKWKSPLLEEATHVLVFPFRCAMNPEHRLDYIALVEGDVFKKVGQYPSVADLSFPQLDTYKKVMSTDDRREFGRALGLYASGIGAGSYVYLRRIFERLLMKAKENAGTAIDEQSFNQAHVDEKITMLKDFLPNMLTNNPTIYGILSKGIHALSEEECLAYFPVLKECIYMILSEWEDIRKKREQEAALTSSLSKISSNIK